MRLASRLKDGGLLVLLGIRSIVKGNNEIKGRLDTMVYLVEFSRAMESCLIDLLIGHIMLY